MQTPGTLGGSVFGSGGLQTQTESANADGGGAAPQSGGAHNYGPDNKWGDPLSKDLFDSGGVRASLRYYGEAGRNGTQQAVGINFSIPAN
jgi:hypothetical protein